MLRLSNLVRAGLLALALAGAPAAAQFSVARDELLSARRVSFEDAEEWAAEFLAAHPSVASFQLIAPGYYLVTTGGGAEFDFFLDNLVRLLDAPRSERAEILAIYEANVYEMLASVDAPDEPTLENLMPIVRARDYLSNTSEAAEAVGRDYAVEPVSRELAGDLVALVGFDTPATIGVAPRSSLSALGLDDAAAFAQALSNLRIFAEMLIWEEEGGLRMAILDTNYESSLLLLDEMWDGLEVEMGGELAVAIPARGILVVGRADLPEHVDVLESIAAEAVLEPYALSADVLVRRNGRWAVMEP